MCESFCYLKIVSLFGGRVFFFLIFAIPVSVFGISLVVFIYNY